MKVSTLCLVPWPSLSPVITLGYKENEVERVELTPCEPVPPLETYPRSILKSLPNTHTMKYQKIALSQVPYRIPERGHLRCDQPQRQPIKVLLSKIPRKFPKRPSICNWIASLWPSLLQWQGRILLSLMLWIIERSHCPLKKEKIKVTATSSSHMAPSICPPFLTTCPNYAVELEASWPKHTEVGW